MSNGVTAWSYSRYSDYKLCPLKFKLKHIDKLKEPGSPAMERGSAIHKLGETFLTAPQLEPVPVPKTRKKPVIDEIVIPIEYANFQEEMVQLRGLSPLVEQQWGFTQAWEPAAASARDPHGWFAGDTWLRIVTDVTVVYDDDTADIVDFKTGKMYDTNQEQMELFSCGPFMKFPKVEAITTRLWYLDVPDPKGNGANVVEQQFSRDDFERIKGEWTQRIVPMFKDKRFAPTPNDKCRWCHFSRAKGGPCKY